MAPFRCATRQARPSRHGEFIGVTVVSEFHHEIDPDPAVAVIIVVRLPDGSKGVHRHLVVVPEIPAQGLQFAPIEIAAENQTLPIRFAVPDHFVARLVHNQPGAVRGLELMPAVAHVEIKFSVGSEHKRMSPVIVIHTGYPRKQNLLLVRLVIAIGVGENKNVRRTRNDHPVAQHADAQGRVDVVALVKDGFLVSPTVSVGVLEDHDAIAFRTQFAPFLKEPVIGAFRDPDPSTCVDVHICRVPHHGLGSKERGLEPFGNRQVPDLFGGGRRPKTSRIGSG